MNTTRTLDELLALSPVIAVVTINVVAHAVPLARALVRGGIKTIEITLRTPVALEAISAIAKDVPEAVIGAGTLLRPDDFAAAAAAGASFGVSPGATPQLLEAGRASKIPFLPGVATPSEAMCAREHGYETLKFFPANAAGGIDMLKALYGPFPKLRFCPTGGIGAENAQRYLDLPNVVCVGGSWLAPASAMSQADWAAIEAEARRAATTLRRAAGA
jgi:2-dehydro-3-deoxyphosphogluconate aldolase/(4S)-4-hydroxy-2-oxoglutarate aldolase